MRNFSFDTFQAKISLKHKYVWISDLQLHLLKGKPYFMSDNTRPDPEILKTWNCTPIPWPISVQLVVKIFPEERWKFNASGQHVSSKGACSCQSASVPNTAKPHFRSLLEWVKGKWGWGEAITSERKAPFGRRALLTQLQLMSSREKKSTNCF